MTLPTEKWIPVSEALPPPGRRVLVATPNPYLEEKAMIRFGFYATTGLVESAVISSFSEYLGPPGGGGSHFLIPGWYEDTYGGARPLKNVTHWMERPRGPY